MVKKVRTSSSTEFKREAVRLVTNGGYKISEAVRSLGINANMLSRWIRQIKAQADTAFPGKVS
jgi:transposase